MFGLFKKEYRVVATIWPYKEGYGVYNGHTLAADGLSYDEASQQCNELNGKAND